MAASGSPHTSRTVGVAVGLILTAASAAITNTATNSRPAPLTTASAPSITTAATSPPAPLPSSSGGLLEPDPELHPGLPDPHLTAAKLCAPGYTTSSVRPRSSYTQKLKKLELGDGGDITAPSGATYTVTGEHLPGTIGDYELDHLISLELGGNPEDPANLWMQPWENRGAKLAPPGMGASAKDTIENRLHKQVCAGTIPLADAQEEIASDWLALLSPPGERPSGL